MSRLKELVYQFWQEAPCGAKDVTAPEGTFAFFEEVERQRYRGDHFMFEVVGFDRWRGRKVLEVGCGLGTDLLQFARGGAEVHAVDLTARAVELTRKRLALYGFEGSVQVADAERLPFPPDTFDLVYSWGVIHHTPDPAAAAAEIMRVCKPGGSVLVMVCHLHSLFAFQAWLAYGLFRGKPRRSLAEVIRGHVESPGTKAYTREEALGLLPELESVRLRTIVTRYDARLGRRVFLPRWVRTCIPLGLGWFLVIEV